MNSFAARVRKAAVGLLPEGAFLRRDRGDGLFISDAPRREPNADWRAQFAEAGFVCEFADGLARLTPGADWLSRLEAETPEPPDFLCASLMRFANLPPGDEALKLFALGLRALDGGDPAEAAAFDRRLRQRAAVALRDGSKKNGGGLYACALIHTFIEEERT